MTTDNRRYPIGIQTFSEIIRKGYVYVDKTDLVWLLQDYAILTETKSIEEWTVEQA